MPSVKVLCIIFNAMFEFILKKKLSYFIQIYVIQMKRNQPNHTLLIHIGAHMHMYMFTCKSLRVVRA